MSVTTHERRSPLGHRQDYAREMELATLAGDTIARENLLRGLHVAGMHAFAGELARDYPTQVTA